MGATNPAGGDVRPRLTSEAGQGRLGCLVLGAFGMIAGAAFVVLGLPLLAIALDWLQHVAR